MLYGLLEAFALRYSDPVSSESINLMETRTHRPNAVVHVKQAGSPRVLSRLARAEYRALLNGMTHEREVRSAPQGG